MVIYSNSKIISQKRKGHCERKVGMFHGDDCMRDEAILGQKRG